MKTNGLLIPALRQYRHNNSDDLLTAFAWDETNMLVNKLVDQLEERDKRIAALTEALSLAVEMMDLSIELNEVLINEPKLEEFKAILNKDQ